MRQVFRVVWEALKDFWEELFLLALMNIVTVLLLVPVVTFPPALAGLWSVANLVVKGSSVHWSDYFAGFRRYFLKAWGLALLNILVVVILVTNIRFYAPGIAPFDISPNVSMWIQAVFVGTAVLWFVLQLYPMALVLEQDDQRLRLALRNAAVLLIANPGFTLLLLLFLLLVAVISTLLPPLWFLITLSLFAVVCNKAVLHLLEPYRQRAQEEEEASDEDEPSDE